MHDLLRRCLLPLLFAGSLPPQSEEALQVDGLQVGGLQVGGAAPPLADLLGALSQRVRVDEHADLPFDTAHTVLGSLRLGEHRRAANLLARTDELAVGAAAWTTVAHYWYLRATGDAATVRARWPALRDAVARACDAADKVTFADEALLVHALYCLGAIAERNDRDRASWQQRALDRLQTLERETWQPGRGHFRPRLTRGAIVLPERADPSVLAPAAAGMLIATGDRTLRHLRTVLDELLAGTAAETPPAWAECFASRAAAFTTCAAAQLNDHEALRRLWPRLLDHPDRGAAAAGCRLDAILFAITGQRLATGVGVDEGWLRLRPWLPPGHTQLELRGLRAEGAMFDLRIAARCGPLQTDERDDEAMQDEAAGARLRIRVLLREAPGGGAQRFVLQGPSASYVASLEPGEEFERSLPSPSR